jgi:hypothetical protein
MEYLGNGLFHEMLITFQFLILPLIRLPYNLKLIITSVGSYGRETRSVALMEEQYWNCLAAKYRGEYLDLWERKKKRDKYNYIIRNLIWRTLRKVLLASLTY